MQQKAPCVIACAGIEGLSQDAAKWPPSIPAHAMTGRNGGTVEFSAASDLAHNIADSDLFSTEYRDLEK
jgi:hypothetical protein